MDVDDTEHAGTCSVQTKVMSDLSVVWMIQRGRPP